ncbi:MAG: DNA repair protein RadA [Alphaproteobacteria bacterium]|nr:MAG: DNA repair protein RadA [Alphaproteobacteria bacterium]
MARGHQNFVCQACGALTKKWQGKCDACGEWNTILEEVALEAPGFGQGAGKGKAVKLSSLSGPADRSERFMTGIAEFDRTLGGGAVPGTAILVGGDPGIGKSTLLLQALARMSESGLKCVYITGEESVDQIRLRASRLGLQDADIKVASETRVKDILATLTSAERPDVVVIDSIQTMYSEAVDSSPGSLTQVRLSSQNLIHFAKKTGAAIFLIGHVTKSGQLAGPKTMEHMVDTVLYFEGEKTYQYRILRTTKNRFGSNDEIGVFEMTGTGLIEVKNPSSLFLSDHKEATEGLAVFPSIEGTRALLVEIEALVVGSPAAMPRRAVVGWDSGRLAMVLAVLDARLGLGFGASDVYLNIAGGMKVVEPAGDVPVAAALISSLTKRPLPADMVMLGEISLSGDIRPAAHLKARLKEAEKLGFGRALVPKAAKLPKTTLNLIKVEKVGDLLDLFDIKATS